MTDKVTITARRVGSDWHPRIRAGRGKRANTWTLETGFANQTDALDAGYAWARAANWCRPVKIDPPYTRVGGRPWPELEATP